MSTLGQFAVEESVSYRGFSRLAILKRDLSYC